MDRYEQVTQAIYAAMDEVNDLLGPERALEKSPDTTLIGEAGTLDSQEFISLAVALEENVERIFNNTLSVIDVLLSEDRGTLTVATLAKRIAKLVG
jgi:hypothetical protein